MCLRIALLAACALIGPASAQGTAPVDPLVVATKDAPPFSFRGEGGEWQGLSIDLWGGIAADLGLAFEFQEASLDELVAGLEDGRFDASVAALTITPEREEVLDFTHTYYPSGLGIVVSDEGSGGVLSTALRTIVSPAFLSAVGTLALVLFLGGAALWLFERKRNAEQFGGTAVQGLGSAFWWSATTMTTVGYGDKAPVTAGGRFLGIVWMFAGVITISSLTAAIASTLTLGQLQSSIQGPEDLAGAGSIACVRGSTGEEYLVGSGLPRTAYATAAEAVAAVAEGRTKAAVHDEPILRHLVLTGDEGGVHVLPGTFERQDYAIALPLDSELRKEVNPVLIERTKGDEWERLLTRYLGAAE